MSGLEAFIIGLMCGIVLGLYFGRQSGMTEFFKYPSSHWRIRGR